MLQGGGGVNAYAQLATVLKEAYGPKPEVRGRTYRDVLTFVEFARRRRRSQKMDDECAAFAHKLGLKYELRDRVHSLLYENFPTFALVGGKPKKRDPYDVHEMDVRTVQRPTCQSTDGDYGPRATFTPEEAEERRRRAMGLDREECPCCGRVA